MIAYFVMPLLSYVNFSKQNPLTRSYIWIIMRVQFPLSQDVYCTIPCRIKLVDKSLVQMPKRANLQSIPVKWKPKLIQRTSGMNQSMSVYVTGVNVLWVINQLLSSHLLIKKETYPCCIDLRIGFRFMYNWDKAVEVSNLPNPLSISYIDNTHFLKRHKSVDLFNMYK